MHVAYSVNSVLKVEIESITAFDNNVILGTRSGQLIMYSVDDDNHVDMLMFNKNFSKKAIVQMEVIAPERLLFVLTDSMIHVCDISHAFNFINSAPQTKGCTLFSVDVQTAKSSTGDAHTVIRVCCAIKRHLEFFFWKMDQLHSPPFSIELKDVPKALLWVDDIMCVGFKDEYVIYNIKPKVPEKHDLISTSLNNVDPCISLIKNKLIGVSKDEFLVPIDPSRYVNDDKDKKTHPVVDHSILRNDMATQLKSMAWSNHLLNLVWDEPYALGRVANCIEVRTFDSTGINKDTLIQTIPLNKIKFLVRSAQGTIFAASVSELWCIRMEDIKVQIQELLPQKKFQLAIDLTSISSDPEDIKTASIRQIHMRSAKEFFRNKLFSEAMTEFIKAHADPYDVIRLFPNLWPEQSNVSKESVEDAILVPEVKQNLDDRDLENAVVALIDYLKWARQKEVVRQLESKNSNSLLSIIDTTMLKCYLQTNDPLIPTLLRLNKCHFEESEKILKKYNKTSELIILYKKNGKHKKALELLKNQSSIEGSTLYGYDHIIEYLQSLGSAHLQLIFEFANWVLQQDPEEGLTIFTKHLIEVENLPRASVLDFLLSNHRSLVIPYLEHVIHVWKDPNTLIHNVLIKQYREKIQNLMKETEKDGGKPDEEKSKLLKSYREKLNDLLKNSNNYSLDVVLKDFPTNIMLEERALILGRLKKHEKVLAIYIQVLGDIEAASRYCEENYENDNNIFLLLLKTILNPSQQPPYEGVPFHPEFLKPKHDVVLELLNKYAAKISPYKVWPYLPDDMPLHRLHKFLDTALRTQMAATHQSAIKMGLMNAELLRLQTLIQEEENKSVEITENMLCPDCKKRFANQSAFVRYPNGEVVHLSCHDKRTSNA